jgi:hypothetical protein
MSSTHTFIKKGKDQKGKSFDLPPPNPSQDENVKRRRRRRHEQEQNDELPTREGTCRSI